MVEIQKLLNAITYIKYIGNPNFKFNKVIPLDAISSAKYAITWCNDSSADQLNSSFETLLFVVSKSNPNLNKIKNYIIVENPRRTFQEILTLFFAPKTSPYISKSATIASNVKMGKDVYIGHNVVVEENCIIGDFAVILHNTIILHDTIIGDNVKIGSNNTIGGVGFGYEKNTEGDFELIPHIGNVIIKNNVDIGNNTCIDRAVLGSTILEQNVKVDNLVHIAHGVKVGRNSVVIANAMVAGSVTIGENSWIAPSSSILNKKNVGDNALIGLGAVVTKHVANNDIVVGNPARTIKTNNQSH